MSKGKVYLLVTFLWATLCLSVHSGSLDVQKTYYDTLGVQETATDRQIQKAFHKLAVKFHPDKNKSAEAESIFREIVEAYEVLSDQDSRRIYDNLGHEAFLQDEDFHPHKDEHPEEAFFHFHFDDFFSSLDLDEDNIDDFFMDDHQDSDHNHWGFDPMGSEQDMDDLYEEQHILDKIFFDTPDHQYIYGYEDDEDSDHFY